MPKKRKDQAINIRTDEDHKKKLNHLVREFELSQAKVIEFLIEQEYEHLKRRLEND